MLWWNEVEIIFYCWYGGNEVGNVVVDVIFGKVSLSGKLFMMFFMRIEDGLSFFMFGSDNGKMFYVEDVFVGYRWFEKRDIVVVFFFGWVMFFGIEICYSF